VNSLRRLLVTSLVTAVVACERGNQPKGAISFGDARADSIIRRDLTAYFTRRAGTATRVSYEYLRNGPTVTGIAYPKFYVWVRADPLGGGSGVEGPARIALIDSSAEVTHFFSHDSGTVAPPELDAVFPASVAASLRRSYWK
jgi:hypothetical protein